MRKATRVMIVGVAALLAVAGCTVKKTKAPALAGPSELGLSLAMQAIPDAITRDGASQSQIVITARDGSGQAVRNVGVRLDVVYGGAIVDFGSLSAKNVVTGSDGRATVTYTAPAASIDPSFTGTVVEFMATPVGSDFNNATPRFVSLRLMPPGVILPPNGAPQPRFTYSPQTPLEGTSVIFDASTSTDDGVIVNYAWNFGDGSTASGQTVSHQFTVTGDYLVTLTVTDDSGRSVTSAPTTVKVGASQAPTAAFVFSPSAPVVNQDIFFNASTSMAGPGRTIVAYDWDFGSGSQQRGMSVSKAYDVPGTYNVVLVVTDDVGKRGTITKAVTIVIPTVATFSAGGNLPQ